MPSWNSLAGEPYPEVDDSGMTQLMDTTYGSSGRNDYPLAGGDGTNIGVAGLVVAAVAILLLLRLGGFRAMVAVTRG